MDTHDVAGGVSVTLSEEGASVGPPDMPPTALQRLTIWQFAADLSPSARSFKGAPPASNVPSCPSDGTGVPSSNFTGGMTGGTVWRRNRSMLRGATCAASPSEAWTWKEPAASVWQSAPPKAFIFTGSPGSADVTSTFHPSGITAGGTTTSRTGSSSGSVPSKVNSGAVPSSIVTEAAAEPRSTRAPGASRESTGGEVLKEEKARPAVPSVPVRTQ